MKSHFGDIDHAIKRYIKDTIDLELNKEMEELIFFSSYTIQFDVFKKATQKLKRTLRHKIPYDTYIWECDALEIIRTYHLHHIEPKSARYSYLLNALLKAQIEINESVMNHFIKLCKQAHSFEYIESRVEEIYKLLFDEPLKEEMYKTSSLS